MNLKLTIAVCFCALNCFGTTYNCANTSYASVSGTNAFTVDGDTLIIPAGTNTWSSGITITNGITVIGAGTNATRIINSQSDGSGFPPLIGLALYADVPVTISNIWFEGGNAGRDNSAIQGNANPGVHYTGTPNGTPYITPTKVRVAWCVIHGFHFGLMAQDTFGVCDHCVLSENYGSSRMSGMYITNYFCQLPFAPYPWNTTHTWDYEDDTFYWTASQYAPYMFGDTEGPASLTVRHCTFNVTDTSNFIEGFDMHGSGDFVTSFDCPANNLANNQVGLQIYNNTLNTLTTGHSFELCDIRGGYGTLVYSNTVNLSGAYINVRTDPAYSATPNNTYFWANTSGGSLIVPAVGSENGSPAPVLGVNYFTNAPAGLSQLAYPHPLIGGGLLPAVNLITVGQVFF